MSEKRAVADEVINGFKEVGFIYLDQHGIPDATVKNVFDKVGTIGEMITSVFVHFDSSSLNILLNLIERGVLPASHRSEGMFNAQCRARRATQP